MKSVLSGIGSCFLVIFLLSVTSIPTMAETTEIKSVQADFSQEKSMPILTAPIRSEGKLFFQAPNKLRWQYNSPFKSVLLLNDGVISKYVEKDGKLIKEDGMQLERMAVILQEISKWLSGDFNDNKMFKVKEESNGKIILSPQEGGAENIIKEIVLIPGKEKGVIDEVIIDEGADSITRMIFSNSRINQTIEPELFSQP